MTRNSNVYISAPSGDDPAVTQLLAALKDKGVNIWRGPAAQDALSSEAAQQLDTRDTLIRVLNARTSTAAQMSQEFAEFQRLRANDAQNGAARRRVIFNLVMDDSYQAQPGDAAADFTFRTAGKPQSAWLPTIFSEIGALNATPALSDNVPAMTMIAGVLIALVLAGTVLWILYAAHFGHLFYQ